MTFHLDLEHTLDAHWPGVHLVKVWWWSGYLSARRSDLRKSLQTDRQTDRRTDDGRLAILLAHSWNELKISNLSSPHSFSRAQKAPKSVFGRGSAQTPLGELTTLPRPPSRLRRGIPPSNSPPHSTPSASQTRRLGSQAPSTQNPGYASACRVGIRCENSLWSFLVHRAEKFVWLLCVIVLIRFKMLFLFVFEVLSSSRNPLLIDSACPE